MEKSLTQQICDLPEINKDELNIVTCSQFSTSSWNKSKSTQESNRSKNDYVDVKPIFVGGFQNDGESGDFDGTLYPHSRQMINVCIKTFFFLIFV